MKKKVVAEVKKGLMNDTAYMLRNAMSLAGFDLNDQHFKDTPDRVARMWAEFSREGMHEKIRQVLSHSFTSNNDEMISVPNIDAVSLCPHHLMPVVYRAHVGYIPNGRVLGLSKIPRLVKLLAQRPIIQEDLVVWIAEMLVDRLKPVGVIVVLDGQHTCMRARGIREPNSVVRTSKVTGVFAMDDSSAKAEFFDLINHYSR